MQTMTDSEKAIIREHGTNIFIRSLLSKYEIHPMPVLLRGAGWHPARRLTPGAAGPLHHRQASYQPALPFYRPASDSAAK